MISFDTETQALKLCEMRASLISRNMANSDTPEFKARDIDFKKAMAQANAGLTLTETNPNHLSPKTSALQSAAYRVPMQLKRDGNTVDNEIERKNFIDNTLKYQASLGFIERKANQYIKAIRGE